jgi:hypothetical protein
MLLKVNALLAEFAKEEIPSNVLFKPTKKKLSIKDLKKEQGYKGANRAIIDDAIMQMDIPLRS